MPEMFPAPTIPIIWFLCVSAWTLPKLVIVPALATPAIASAVSAAAAVRVRARDRIGAG